MDEPLTLRHVRQHLEDRLMRDDVVQYVEQLARSVDAASREILRLGEVIDDPVRRATNLVVSNFEVEPVTILDIGGMRTLVRCSPTLSDFYLAEPMGGWSPDHKRHFHKMVVREFSERNAEKIAKSIWATAKAA